MRIREGLAPWLFLVAVVAIVVALLTNALIGKRDSAVRYEDYPDHPLVVAAMRGDDARAKKLLKENPALVNVPLPPSTKESGRAPLHYAAMRGHKAVVEVLLEYGADTNMLDPGHYTPLQLAVHGDYQDVANLLLTHNAQLDIFSAAGLGMTETVSRFLDEGAKLASTTHPDGRTPLHWAAAGGQKTVAELLLARGASADSNSPGYHGWHRTPLHDAAYHGRRDLAELLLKHKANVNAKNDTGQTALHVAAERGERAIAELLLTYHANVNAREDKAYSGPAAWDDKPTMDTPLRKAKLYGRNEVAELLQQHGGIE